MPWGDKLQPQYGRLLGREKYFCVAFGPKVPNWRWFRCQLQVVHLGSVPSSREPSHVTKYSLTILKVNCHHGAGGHKRVGNDNEDIVGNDADGFGNWASSGNQVFGNANNEGYEASGHPTSLRHPSVGQMLAMIVLVAITPSR